MDLIPYKKSYGKQLCKSHESPGYMGWIQLKNYFKCVSNEKPLQSKIQFNSLMIIYN